MELPKKQGRSNSTAPIQVVPDANCRVLELILSKESNGITKPQIKYGIGTPPLSDATIKKILDSLIGQMLIKEVVDIRYKRSKLYMGFKFEPSNEVIGGEWYEEGKLDVELISELRKQCLKHFSDLEVATIEKLLDAIHRSRVFMCKFSPHQIHQIVKALSLGGAVEEMTRLMSWHQFLVGFVLKLVIAHQTVLSPPKPVFILRNGLIFR